MDPYIGEIRCFAFGKVPSGWLACEGQTLQIQTYQALAAALGTTYGGDGRTSFQLPDLRGRVPMHFGSATPLGQHAGVETETLSLNEMAAHTHPLQANNTVPTAFVAPSGNFIAAVGTPALSFGPSGTNVAMAADIVSAAGTGQAHTNMQPFLVLTYCIATTGIWPQRP